MPATKTNLRNVSQSIAVREGFDCNGTLHGRNAAYMPDRGRLPERFVESLHAASLAPDFYVVVSYATPIAWFANGQWFVPTVKYSVSTSRQLSSLRIPNPVYL